MPREFCWSCMRPKASCLCPSEPPMQTATRIVLLMHPKEWRDERCNTGRLTCLNLANSEIIPGLAFGDDPRYRALVDDPRNYCCLLYPGKGSYNLSEGGFPAGVLGGRRLVVFLIDATWACSKAVLRESPCLLELPRLMFTPAEPSRYYIKRQPASYCLSTLEATHEILLALEKAGLDSYPDKERLIDVFMRMQAFQAKKALEAHNPRHLE